MENTLKHGLEEGDAFARTGVAKAASQSAYLRFAAISAPAAIVTTGLFLLMSSLIAAEYTGAEASEVREIPVIVPELDEPEKPQVRPPVEKLEVAQAPPPPPKYSVSKEQVPLLGPRFPGEPPVFNGPATVQPIVVQTVHYASDTRPVRPPRAVYPQRAIARNLEGECVVSFDVNVRGRPFNVAAKCTNTIFEGEAIRAVRKAEFIPKFDDRGPVERYNVVYPIEFTLSE